MGSALSDPRERFEDLVVEAMDGLPAWVHERLENVDVLIEEGPPDQPNLLGRYEGIPLTRRGSNYFGVLPDRITLFRRTIEGAARRGRIDVREVVRHTVIHEVAHFFGISDERLHELDRY